MSAEIDTSVALEATQSAPDSVASAALATLPASAPSIPPAMDTSVPPSAAAAPSDPSETSAKRSIADLDESTITSCDDLIVKLGEANGTGETPDDAARRGLWKLVFANWDTTKPVHRPGPISARRGTETALEVGTWRADLPASAGAKRKAGEEGEAVVIKPHRKAGGRAFMRPVAGFSTFGLGFAGADEKGAVANAGNIKLNPGWTLARARTESMVKWDGAEIARVVPHNTQLVVYWARKRLCALISNDKNGGGGGGIIGDDGIGMEGLAQEGFLEGMEAQQLVQLVTFADRLRELEEFLAVSLPTMRARSRPKMTLAGHAGN